MIQDRGALYYPYIHPRDVEWVKGTLLAFGQIQRVVPDGFPLHDSPDIAFLRDCSGPLKEPLLCSISPEAQEIEAAEGRLRQALAGSPPDELRARFGLNATLDKYGRPDVFEIHEGKFEENLLRDLQNAGLAWPHRASPAPGVWWAVHPELGSALMSVIAIAAARRQGLDIVTEDMTLHHALAALDEKTVLSELLHGALPTEPEPSETQAVDQLAHIVLTTSFDLSTLSMKEVADLVCGGHDLREFKKELSELATAVPADASPERREKLLAGQAERVIDLWQRKKKTWPKRLLGALKEGTAAEAEKETKKAALELTKAALVGGIGAVAAGAALSTVLLPGAAGIGLGAIFAVGKALFSGEDEKGPYRYLTRVEKAGASLLVAPKSYRRGSSDG